jgi:hypothetical protein
VFKGGGSLAYPSRLLSHKRAETSPRQAGNRGPGETIDWASVEDDLEIVRRTNANLLVIGPEYLVMDVVSRVIAHLPANILSPCDAGRLPLSLRLLPPGAVVFRDIHQLDAGGQALLFDWLENGRGDRQIICTATPFLLTLVHAGAFDLTLFYRLNTVSLILRP